RPAGRRVRGRRSLRETGCSPPGAALGAPPSEPRLHLDKVEVLHDVGLALDALRRTRLGLAVVLPLAVFGPGDDLTVDEALLEVGVDAARRLERRGALAEVPARHVLVPRRHEGLHPDLPIEVDRDR